MSEALEVIRMALGRSGMAKEASEAPEVIRMYLERPRTSLSPS